jgi:hypothetical protein
MFISEGSFRHVFGVTPTRVVKWLVKVPRLL